MRTRSIAVIRRGLCGLAALSAFTVLVVASAASAAAAENRAVTLLAPESGDLVPRALATNLPPARPGVPREPVSFSWPVAADQALATRPAPPVQRSKEIWFQAGAAELRQGVSLSTTAPGALVRVNPAPGAGAAPADRALDPTCFELVDERGRVHAGAAALEQAVTAEQLAAAGSPFPEGTAAFRLRADLGAGRFLLRAPDLAAGSGRYVIHVLDHASDLELALESGRTAYLAGTSSPSRPSCCRAASGSPSRPSRKSPAIWSPPTARPGRCASSAR